ncbi:hypothetical protein CCR91_06395 [Thiorhodovibrio winogradskyi]|nr:hypothetical protein [Thiorhodovibrio winogradskyi]
MDSLLQSELRNLPSPWYDQDSAQPTSIAREELAWSLLLAVLGNLLYGDPLATTVFAGRENLPFHVDDARWQDFSTELGLNADEPRQQFVGYLANILRREPVNLEDDLGLPRLSAALVHLVNGFSLFGRGRRRASPSQGALGFDSDQNIPNAASELVDELMAWAGNAATTPKGRYRVAFHVMWRPLSRRSWSEVPTTSSLNTDKLSLPLNFLVMARSRKQTTPTKNFSTKTSTAERENIQQHSSSKRDGAVTGYFPHEVLAVLVEPFLVLRGDPAIEIAAAEKDAQGLAKDLLRTWRRLILTDDLTFFGEPASVLEIKLPNPAWQLAGVPFRRGTTDCLQKVRVMRRGVNLRGELLIPGIVAIEPCACGGKL